MVVTKRHSYKVPKEKGARKTSEATSHDEAEIAGLVEKAAAGDFEAFGELYNIYLDRIYRYVFYQVKDKMTAEDLIEEIFVKAWKAIGSYRGKGQAFSPWLYRIAHNYLVDYFRKSQKHRSLEIEIAAAAASLEQESERKAARQELMEAVSYLRDNQRQVIILKFIEGLDNHEIAQIMGKSQGAIRILQMRALATLRKRLSSEE
jgi:RNA polymerase sigma-70 factor (ECF subfamily)